MALVACPECAKQISTLAAACPHCGCPMQSYEPKQSELRYKSASGTPLQEYQAFIDGLLEWPRISVVARWTREWDNKPPASTYQTPAEFDAKMRLFTPEQRQIVAGLLQEERESSIQTILAYLTDKINVEGLRLSRNGVPLAIEPYGTEMYYDWNGRKQDAPWPELEEE